MDVAHSSLRRAVADRLTQSKRTVPHYTVTSNVNLDSLLSLRERVRQRCVPFGCDVLERNRVDASGVRRS
jgi:pyruvate/2-oxoglutarate dehydrogenase complex dihydrolipoamide acyltransferase (E2) component